MQRTLDRLETEVAALAGVVPCGLPVGELQDLVARTTRVAAQLESIGTRALGELQVRTGGNVPDGPTGAVCPTPAWLRTATGVSGHAAGRRIRTAVALRELPLVSEATVAGAIT